MFDKYAFKKEKKGNSPIPFINNKSKKDLKRKKKQKKNGWGGGGGRMNGNGWVCCSGPAGTSGFSRGCLTTDFNHPSCDDAGLDQGLD